MAFGVTYDTSTRTHELPALKTQMNAREQLCIVAKKRGYIKHSRRRHLTVSARQYWWWIGRLTKSTKCQS